MNQPLVRYDVDGRGVARVVLDDPRTRNALSDVPLDELLARLDQARDDEAVRVVVLTSADERVFSSGGDLKAFADDAPLVQKYAGLARFPRLYERLGGLGKPTLCAANGDVLAGTFGLALACDLVLAKQGVRLGCPEINVGVFPFMISALIYRSVPRVVANELMMTGELITAEQAHELHVSTAWCRRRSSTLRSTGGPAGWPTRSPLLMQLGKDALTATRDLALPDALAHLRAQLALAFATKDLREGVAAFRDKREPVWRRR